MSTENLDLPHLMDLDVDCVMGHVSTEQIELFNHRNNVETNELTLYFVRSTNRPLNGCASHPDGRPGAVVTRVASEWTLGHEIGHVLGLTHVNDTNRLMYGGGTHNITNPPPDLITSEIDTMIDSPFTI
ncbi:matrixin family metalloprotease [Bacillus sp. B-TM1]